MTFMMYLSVFGCDLPPPGGQNNTLTLLLKQYWVAPRDKAQQNLKCKHRGKALQTRKRMQKVKCKH